MAASSTDIINVALSLIGQQAIVNLDEGTDRANLMGRLYPITRDAIIRAFPWNFAVEFITVAKDAAVPTWGFSYQYTLSPDPYVLRVLKVEDDDDPVDPVVWRVYGRKIHTDVNSPINYAALVRVEDTGFFDPLFEDALQFRLAAAAAPSLTESGKLTQGMMQLYQAKIDEARTVDSQEGSPISSDITVLLDARRSGVTRNLSRRITPV